MFCRIFPNLRKDFFLLLCYLFLDNFLNSDLNQPYFTWDFLVIIVMRLFCSYVVNFHYFNFTINFRMDFFIAATTFHLKFNFSLPHPPLATPHQQYFCNGQTKRPKVATHTGTQIKNKQINATTWQLYWPQQEFIKTNICKRNTQYSITTQHNNNWTTTIDVFTYQSLESNLLLLL